MRRDLAVGFVSDSHGPFQWLDFSSGIEIDTFNLAYPSGSKRASCPI